MRTKGKPSGLLGGVAVAAIAAFGAVAPAQAQDTVLNLIHFAPFKAATEEAIASFQAANPGIQIRASFTAEPQAVRAQFTTGNAPDITLVYPGDGSAMAAAQLAKAGLLEDLSDRPWAKTISPSFRQGVSHDGKVYVVPTGYSYIAMYTNDEVMKSIGADIPKTFTELLAFCDKAKATTTPIAFGLKEQIPTLFPGYALASSTAFADNPNFAADQAAGRTNFQQGYRRSLEMYLEMRDRGCFSRTASGNSNDDALRLIAGGRAAMFVGVNAYLPAILRINADAKITQSPFPGNADASKVRVPLGPTIAYAVTAQSRNKEAAKRFLDHLANPDVNRKWAETAAQLAAADIDAAPKIPGNSAAIAAALAEKRTVLYLDRTWPNGRVQPIYMAGIQELFGGQTTIDALLKRLDEAFASGAP
jgi:raffinose/stachyose/melibiose transport system substrate-binding protein